MLHQYLIWLSSLLLNDVCGIASQCAQEVKEGDQASLVVPFLECWDKFWAFQYTRNMDKLESVQGRAIRISKRSCII